jgi:hypothetical protein
MPLDVGSCSVLTSVLPAGTGWVHPQRAAGRAGRRVRRTWIDGFFFSKSYLPVSYSCPSRVHGYGYGGTQARARIQDLFFCCF